MVSSISIRRVCNTDIEDSTNALSNNLRIGSRLKVVDNR